KDPSARYADMADLEAAICEAQISDGLVTAWDDLSLPNDIDPARRAAILDAMPRDQPRRKRPGWVLPATLGSAILAGGLATYLLIGGEDPLFASQRGEVERLTNEARAAAGRA